MGKQMTCNEQLKEWVEGNSIHNDARDECCPDFSCCEPELLADRQTRETFANANDETRHEMLLMFLGGYINSDKVYVSGSSGPLNG